MKQSGLGDNLYLGGYDLSGDTNSLGAIGGGPAALDVTPINKSGFERIGGLRDGRIEWTSYFNPSTDQTHDVLSTRPTTDRTITYCRGTALGSPAAAMVAKQLNYDPTRAADGSLTIALSAQANGFGLEWGNQLTAGIRTDTAATDGLSVDLGATAPAGLFGQAYLHVFAFTGVDATIKIQTSDDNGALDPFSDRITFAQVTAGPTSQRAVHANAGQSIERYARVVTTTAGGFTELRFAVMLVQNTVAVSF